MVTRTSGVDLAREVAVRTADVGQGEDAGQAALLDHQRAVEVLLGRMRTSSQALRLRGEYYAAARRETSPAAGANSGVVVPVRRFPGASFLLQDDFGLEQSVVPIGVVVLGPSPGDGSIDQHAPRTRIGHRPQVGVRQYSRHEEEADQIVDRRRDADRGELERVLETSITPLTEMTIPKAAVYQ